MKLCEPDEAFLRTALQIKLGQSADGKTEAQLREQIQNELLPDVKKQMEERARDKAAVKEKLAKQRERVKKAEAAKDAAENMK